MESISSDGETTASSLHCIDSDQKLVSADECRLIALSCIAKGLDWSTTRRVISQRTNSEHPVMLKAIREYYVCTLTEIVLGTTLAHITELCCSRNNEFLSIARSFEEAPLNSNLWMAPTLLNADTNQRMVETRRLKILAELLAQQPGRHKQILAKLRKLLNQIVTHFSKEQPEKELVRLIINWFKSGEMCIEHYRTWRALTEEGSFSLSDIRKANWFENSENSFFTNFKIALKELPVKDLCRESYGQLWRFLSNLASKTEPKKERTGIRLRLFSKLLFLSDVRSKLETFLRDNPSIFEVNIYAEYAIILDCNLENFTWHGINLSLAAEKIIIRKECEINVSDALFGQI